MIEKIKNALKTEYAKLGLGDKAFDGVASFLVKTITKEDEIDGVIKSEDTKNLLKAFQGESDSLRNRAAQLQKDLDAYKQAHPDKDDEKGGKGEEGGDNNAILNAIAALTKRLDERDAKEKRETSLSSVTAKLKAKNCTNAGALRATLKGFSLGENETEDQAVERLEAEYNEYLADMTGSAVPPAGGAGHKDDEKAFQKSLEAFAESKGLGGKDKE
jgi:hypothetical protein